MRITENRGERKRTDDKGRKHLIRQITDEKGKTI
jgi:hypothetical protein